MKRYLNKENDYICIIKEDGKSIVLNNDGKKLFIGLKFVNFISDLKYKILVYLMENTDNLCSYNDISEYIYKEPVSDKIKRRIFKEMTNIRLMVGYDTVINKSRKGYIFTRKVLE